MSSYEKFIIILLLFLVIIKLYNLHIFENFEVFWSGNPISNKYPIGIPFYHLVNDKKITYRHNLK